MDDCENNCAAPVAGGFRAVFSKCDFFINNALSPLKKLPVSYIIYFVEVYEFPGSNGADTQKNPLALGACFSDC